MGWTSYLVHGKVNRKVECDNLYANEKHMKLLKSALVGSTYFAAIRFIKEFDELLGDYVDVPEQDQKVKAFIILTSIKTDHSGTWFSYKDMSEECGSYDYQCPDSILNLLTPTSSQYANDWRNGCRRYQQKKKDLRKAPYGTRIEVSINEDMIVFEKKKNGNRTHWLNSEWEYIPESRIPDYEFQFV